MDDRKHIKKIFPFVKEIERTAFYSGLLAFVPSGVKIENDALLEMIKKRDVADSSNVEFYSENEYQLIHFEDFSL